MSDEKTQPQSAPQFDDMTFGTTPNYLTLVRMGFVPLVVAALHMHDPDWDIVGGLLFSAAAITDYFDGYLARTRKQITIYGKLLDPLADKFLVVSSLVMLQEMGRIPPYVVIVLICRELAITGLRALASAEGVIIPASGSAKWKTVAQMFAIPFLMAKQGFLGLPVYPVGQFLLYFSLSVSLWSAKDYVVDFFRAARESRAKRSAERKLARAARAAGRASRFAARLKGKKPE